MITQSASATGGAQTSYQNQVPVLGKLMILPVLDFDPAPIPIGPPYFAMFNPENWQIQTTLEHSEQSKDGGDGAVHAFKRIAPATLSFDLVIDGTGASGEKREVIADITYLKTILLFNGVLHKPNNLLVVWSTQIFKGVLTSFTVKHTLFRADGTPLRATVSLSLTEQKSIIGMILGMNLGSADLTHYRQVKANDRLDLICHQIYRDPKYYLEVARANNLTSFRKLPVGSEITFPPVEK